MNKQVRRVSFAVVAMFLSLFIVATVVQVLRADDLYKDSRNVRSTYETYKTQRGSILVEGVPIAYSVPVNDAYRFDRIYESEIYTSVTGYFSIFAGTDGIERMMNSYLSGQSSAQFFEQINALLDGKPVTGAAVELTLQQKIQRVAWEALGNKKGSVIAIEPATGKILALVSKPSYDANQLSTHLYGPVTNAYKELNADENRPLINRAIAGDLYHPGSVFKLVVAAAALESGQYTISSTFENLEEYRLPGTVTTIRNSGRGPCGPDPQVTLAVALARSCNIPFAQLAVALGQDRIRAQAQLLGFGDELAIPLDVTPSIYPEGMDQAQTALTGFGQFDVRVTPMQMAMVTSAIANQGIMLQPQLISTVVASNLNVLMQPTPKVLAQPMSRENAGLITKMMVDSVEIGAASRAGISGVAVAGKTGTAENGPTDPYTLWFAGFAPAEKPEVAVVVVIEDGGGQGQNGTGNQLAAPIAKKVIEAVLSK